MKYVELVKIKRHNVVGVVLWIKEEIGLYKVKFKIGNNELIEIFCEEELESIETDIL